MEGHYATNRVGWYSRSSDHHACHHHMVGPTLQAPTPTQHELYMMILEAGVQHGLVLCRASHILVKNGSHGACYPIHVIYVLMCVGICTRYILHTAYGKCIFSWEYCPSPYFPTQSDLVERDAQATKICNNCGQFGRSLACRRSSAVKRLEAPVARRLARMLSHTYRTFGIEWWTADKALDLFAKVSS